MEDSPSGSGFQQEPKQKGFKLDMSWKENKEALVAIMKWVIFLILLKLSFALFGN